MRVLRLVLLFEQKFIPTSETFLNQAPFSFDLSVMDLYLSLSTGGTLFSLGRGPDREFKGALPGLSKVGRNYLGVDSDLRANVSRRAALRPNHAAASAPFPVLWRNPSGTTRRTSACVHVAQENFVL
jgi:hypothetical protein